MIALAIATGLIAMSGPATGADPRTPASAAVDRQLMIDLNHDGAPDEIRIRASEHSASVALKVNGRRSVIEALIASPLFGQAVAPVGDIDGLGVDDLAISAPEDFGDTDRPGRVYVYSSETGILLHTLFGLRHETFGATIDAAGDRDLDGIPDVEAFSEGADAAGEPYTRRYIFSGASGRRIFDHIERSAPDPRQAKAPSIVGDLDHDRDIDADDLGLLLHRVGQPLTEDATGDLNGDGVVDAVDMRILIDSFGGPVAFVEAGCPSSELCPDGYTCPPCDGDGSGTVGGGGGGDGGGHGPPLGGGGHGNPPPSPLACQLLISAPDEMLYGETVEIAVDEFPDVENPNIIWTVTQGSELLASSGVTADPRVFAVTAANQTGLVTVEAEFQNAACEGIAVKTATIEIDECFLWLGGVPYPSLELGQGALITAHALPEGGVHTWTPAALPEGATFTPNGDKLLISATVSADPGPVAAIAQYTVNGCTRFRLIEFDFVPSPTNDADFDGLTDAEEADLGADPANPDTDGDGFSDGCEVSAGFDPLDPNDPAPGSIDLELDTDNDGLPDFIEGCLGTDPDFFDSDGDGLSDGFEIEHGLDPNNPDSDGDGIADGFEDPDSDGLSNLDEQAHGSNPNSSDSDGDGVSDGQEVSRGSFPGDASDNGEVPDDVIQFRLTIGDHSGSHSERWGLNVGPVRLIAPFGDVISETFPFKKGESHEITIVHLGSTVSPPDYDCTADVAAVDPSADGWTIDDSEGILGVHNESSFNFAAAKSATLMINVELELKSITFGGPRHNIVQDTGAAYDTPHWLDDDLDGDAEDMGDRRIPIAYTRGATVTIQEVRFSVGDGNPDLQNIPVFGAGPDGQVFEGTASMAGGDLVATNLTASQTLPDTVKFYNPYTIQWEAALDDEGEVFTSIGASDNRVYVTLSDPQATTLYETVIDIAVRNADGLADVATVVTAVYNDFTDRNVARKAMDGLNSPDGVVMQYWANAGSPQLEAIAGLCQPMAAMINPEFPQNQPQLQNIGTCVAWSELLVNTWRMHGVNGAVQTEVKHPNSPDVFMLVRNWTFEGEGGSTCNGWPYIVGIDAFDALGVPAQGGVSNPPEAFANHFIVSSGGLYYDPSYGSAVSASYTAWETGALAGFVIANSDVAECSLAARQEAPDVVETSTTPHAVP